jgi:hypothetical protein
VLRRARVGARTVKNARMLAVVADIMDGSLVMWFVSSEVVGKPAWVWG